MKIVCEGIELSDALAKVTKACSTKTTNPVLETVKMTAENDGLSLLATDGEISILKKIKAEVFEEGSICVPGKYFAEFSKRLEREQISLSTEGETLLIEYGDSQSTLQTLPVGRFRRQMAGNGRQVSDPLGNIGNIGVELLQFPDGLGGVAEVDLCRHSGLVAQLGADIDAAVGIDGGTVQAAFDDKICADIERAVETVLLYDNSIAGADFQLFHEGADDPAAGNETPLAARAAARAGFHQHVAAGAHTSALHHAHDAHGVGLGLKAGPDGTVNGHVTHEKDIACLEADIGADIEHVFDGDFAVKVEDIPVDVGFQIAGIFRIEMGIGPQGEHRLLQNEALVGIGSGLLEGNNLGDHLILDDVLDVSQIVDVRLPVALLGLEGKMVHVGIEIVAEIICHVSACL